MSSIDERVVGMKFDNAQFDRGVKDTTKSLDNLKKGLNLDASVKSLDGLHAAGSRFSLAGIASGVENLASKFSALSVVGITALVNIGNQAFQTGQRIISSLTVDPIKQGLQEYETNLNAIQTILANTSHQGTNLDQVNSALQELNEYSDKTIYNFSEMARNIGTFTAAGVDLDTSTNAIKGIANLAAVSGSNSQQASTAMYQLSQALSTGKVSLMDWNSVVNAGMGGKVFQDALIETARVQGVAVDDIIKNNGSFRDSLQEGWLTSGILTETLSKFTGDLNEEQLKTMGYNEEQIAGIIQMGKTAQDAATKVKTMSQLIGTLQESAASGWAQTWQLVFGDFEEAKELFTSVNNVLGGMIGASAEARNKVIGDWKELGGRTMAIEGIKNVFESLMAVIKPIGDAFKEIFPPITGEQLANLTRQFRDFTASLRPSEETLNNLKRTAKGFFALIDIGVTIVSAIFGVIKRLVGELSGAGGGFLEVTGNVGDFILKVRDALKSGDGLANVMEKIGDVLVIPIRLLKNLAGVIGEAFGKFPGIANEVGQAGDKIKARLDPLRTLGQFLLDVWRKVAAAFREFGDFLAPVGSAFREFGDTLIDAFKNLNFDVILDLLQTGLLGGILLLIKKFISDGVSVDLSGGFFDNIKDALGGVTDTLSTMQNTLKAATLLAIAAALGILTLSVVALSEIDSAALGKALAAMSAMFIQLMIAMAVFEKISIGAGVFKMGALGTAMILLAIAIRILAGAVEKLSGLDWNELTKGLVGVTVLLGGLAVAGNILSKNSGGLISAGIGMIAVAVAIKILASAVKDFSDLSWEEMAKGLTGVGAVLTALTLFTRLAKVNKGAMASAGGLVLLGVALKIIASAVKDFASMDVNSLIKGLASVTGILAVLAIFIKATSGSKGIFIAAAGMVVLAAALKIMASALEDFSKFSWEEMGRGLAAMAGSLLLITVAVNLMPPNMIVTSAALVIVAAALKILASALKDMGGMSWEEIGKGLVTLAGSLLIIAIAMAGMTAALPGAAALLVVAGALSLLAPVLIALGGMSWDEIGRGLTVLAAALGIIALAGLLLTPVVPTLLGLGIAMGLLGVGAVLVGAGMLAFAMGLTVLAAAGTAAIPVLVSLITEMLKLIPFAFEQFALGIVAFAKVIGDSAPQLVGAMVNLLLALLGAINTIAPEIVATLFNLIMMLLQTLVDNVPKFVDAGMQIIIGFLQGIGNNIGAVITAGANIVIEFIKGIGNNAGRIAEAGADMIIKFVNSLASTIETRSGAMREAGGRLAGAIIDGMTGGLFSGASRAIAAAADMAGQALNAAKKALGINSPSKEFFEIGEFSDEGLANGLIHSVGKVTSAATSVGNSAMDALKKSISKSSHMMDGNMDLSPTIRPVLDLTAIEKDSNRINGLIKPKSIQVDSSYAKASTLAVAERTNQEAAALTKSEAVPAAGDTFTYIQNNNSPKALPASEIYRNTNSQISKKVEELKKK